MLKASALYIVIVVALVIAVLCSSLIVAAYFYRAQYQRKFRYDLLQNNAASGVNILLAGGNQYTTQKLSLFGGDQDSVILKSLSWGLYDVGVSRAFIQSDTLTRICALGNKVDSAKWGALYIIDEDRPLSVSGETEIQGDAFLPKAGVKSAYVDNMAYRGNEKLVQGHQKTSDKTLPALNETRITAIRKLFDPQDNYMAQTSSAVVIKNSFNSPLRVINLGKNADPFTGRINGYILLRSDTTLTLDSSSRLTNVIVCAPAIKVNTGFQGSCQLFAADSIHIQPRCRLAYPSAVGLLSAGTTIQKQGKIMIDSNTVINGSVFSYQKVKSEVQPLISLGNNTEINGIVYSQGILNYQKHIQMNGMMFTNRFLYQSSFTRYENYLINFKLSSKRLSKYYLAGDLFPVSSPKHRILQWLK